MDEFRKEIDNYFCRFTFGQFITLILVEIVTLFFVFYLGAHYGPELLGSRESLSQSEPVLPTEDPKSVEEIVGSSPVHYTYPDVLVDRGGGRKAVRVKPSGITAEEYEHQAREQAKPAAKEKSKEAEEAPQETTEGAAPTSAAKGKFAIQVGSFPSEDEASGVLKRWKSKGYSVFLSVGEIPEKGTWYRVRMGNFSSRQEADAFLARFEANEKVKGLVVLSKN